MGAKQLWHYADILLALTFTCLFALVYFLLPEWKILRVVLGIPFLFIVPGYLLTAVIFPRTRAFPKAHEIAVKKKRKKKTWTVVHRIEKEIDPTVRIALSAGLSLALVGIVSWTFNSLYPVDEDIFGLRSDNLTVAFFLLNSVLGACALIIRTRMGKNESKRFDMRFQLFDGTASDTIITLTLVAILIIAIGAGAYIKLFHEKEGFTELFILGPGMMISDYPEVFSKGDYQDLNLGIVNRENEEMTYSVLISLGSSGPPREIQSISSLVLNSSVSYLYRVISKDGERHVEAMSFAVDVAGAYTFTIRIVKDGTTYREVRLDLKVVEPEYLFKEMNITAYLTDENGSPSTIPDSISGQTLLDRWVRVINSGLGTNVNVTMETGRTLSWIELRGNEWPLLNGSTGIYSRGYLEKDQEGTFPLRSILTDTDHDVVIEINRVEYLRVHVQAG